MASRRLSKSILSVIKAQYTFLRPSLLLRSRSLSASVHFSSLNSSIYRPNSFIRKFPGNLNSSVTQAASHGQLFPLSLQFPSPRRFSTTTSQPNQNEYTEMAWEGLLNAFDPARVLNQQIVESEHLMKALFWSKKMVSGDTSGQILGSSLSVILENAKRHKKEMSDNYVLVEHLLLAFYSDVRFGQEFFKNLKHDQTALKNVIKDVRGSQRVTDQNPERKYEALEKYGNDLTEMARRGKLDPVIRRCIEILCRRTKNNPVIIGVPGVGKTAIAIDKSALSG